jgi:hypothetical protein
MRWTLIDRKWHPVDDGILPLALAAMRALWVWPLLHLWSAGLMPGEDDPIAWPLLFALLAVSTAIAQFAAFRMQWARRGALARIADRGLVAVSGLVAVILTLYASTGQPPLWNSGWLDALAQNPGRSVSTLLVAVWLWWWGVLAGRHTIYYDTYASNFALGTFGLGMTAVFSFGTGVVPLSALLGPALAFFAVSLVTLAVASLRAAQRFEREHADPTFRVSRYWLATIVGVVVVLLVSSLLVAQLITPDIVRRILALASPVLDLVAQVLWWVLMVVAWVVFTVLEGLARLVRSSREAQAEPLKMQPLPDFAAQLKDLPTHPVGVAPGAYQALRMLAGLLLAGIILLIFALAFRRFRTFFEDDVIEVRDSVLTLDLLKAQVAQLFRRTNHPPQPPPFANLTGDDPRACVRRTYQAMLAWMATRDLARAPGITPEEYLQLVSQTLPEHSASLALITAAYVRARYSAELVPAAVAQETARAWEQIARPIQDT